MEKMAQNTRRAAIARLVEVMRDKGSWAGETHIQKSAYFMQALLGVQMGYEFVLYKHGPYSFDLRSDLSTMMASLQLDVKPRQPYGPSFVLGPLSARREGITERIEKAIQFVGENLSTHDTRKLERLSTALFVKSSKPELDEKEIAAEINRIKPHIEASEAYSAMKDVERLKNKISSCL